MELQILAGRTVSEVQKDFNTAFPFLKIVFFSKSHKAYKGSNAKFLVNDPSTTLRELFKKHHEGLLFIDLEMSTWQLERLFEEEYGLHVQVFRKSGDIWLETSVSDDLTLDMQNAKGKIEKTYHAPIVEPMDYGEQD